MKRIERMLRLEQEHCIILKNRAILEGKSQNEIIVSAIIAYCDDTTNYINIKKTTNLYPIQNENHRK